MDVVVVHALMVVGAHWCKFDIVNMSKLRVVVGMRRSIGLL